MRRLSLLWCLALLTAGGCVPLPSSPTEWQAWYAATRNRQIELHQHCRHVEEIFSNVADDCWRRYDEQHKKIVQAYLKSHPDTDPEVAQMMLAGRVQAGITAEVTEVTFGKPDQVSHAECRLVLARQVELRSYKCIERWQFGTSFQQFLFFRDGRFIAQNGLRESCDDWKEGPCATTTGN
jgi:hypothetical protein